MLDPRFSDDSAAALRLRLYDRALDRSSIGVLVAGAAGGSGVVLEAAVIGASHFIEVRANGTVFTEMLACRAVPEAEPTADLAPGRGTVDRVLAGGSRYRFTACTLEWPQSKRDLDRLRDRISKCQSEPSEIGLSYRFPDTSARAEFSPETLVFAAARQYSVVVRTAHCYPSEGLVVFSSSDLALRPTIPAVYRAVDVHHA